MKSKSLVKLSNIIGIISILLLIYWVFIFISIEVFGFKVFRENITETFYMSVLGILALMVGALIINVMFNLTRIAEKHNSDDVVNAKSSKKWGLLLAVSFPLIFCFLYTGDYLSSKKKEKMLIKSAESIIQKNRSHTSKLVHYTFSEKYIMETADILEIFTETDKNFPNVSVIIKDTISDNAVFLSFRDYYSGNLKDTIYPVKSAYIQKTDTEERAYMDHIFAKKSTDYKYSSHDGNYELFYPVIEGDKVIILHFSDEQRYGKIGS